MRRDGAYTRKHVYWMLPGCFFCRVCTHSCTTPPRLVPCPGYHWLSPADVVGGTSVRSSRPAGPASGHTWVLQRASSRRSSGCSAALCSSPALRWARGLWIRPVLCPCCSSSCPSLLRRETRSGQTILSDVTMMRMTGRGELSHSLLDVCGTGTCLWLPPP